VFTPGGYQPYSTENGRMPGPALLAMLKGGPAFMPHPMNARRQVQHQAAAQGGVTLLDLLRR
jgi:hypothetical protein